MVRCDRAELGPLGPLPRVELRRVGRAMRTARMEAAASGRIRKIGRRARDAGQADDRPVERREGAHQPDGVGVLGALEQVVGRRRLDDLARVHDRDPVAELDEQREVVRDEQDGEPELALQLLDLLQDLALDDHVERSRRLVHDDQLRAQRERHRDHDALAHTARELVGVGADAPAVDADELEQVARARECFRAVDPLVGAEHVDELVADAHHGIERVHRALEDQRDVPPPEPAQLLAVQGRRVLALEEDPSVHDLARRAQNPEERVCDRALPAARLARKADELARPDRQRDVVDRAHTAVVDDEVVELDERLGRRFRHDLRPAVYHGAHAAALRGQSSPASIRRRGRTDFELSLGLLSSSMP